MMCPERRLIDLTRVNASSEREGMPSQHGAAKRVLDGELQQCRRASRSRGAALGALLRPVSPSNTDGTALAIEAERQQAEWSAAALRGVSGAWHGDAFLRADPRGAGAQLVAAEALMPVLHPRDTKAALVAQRRADGVAHGLPPRAQRRPAAQHPPDRLAPVLGKAAEVLVHGAARGSNSSSSSTHMRAKCELQQEQPHPNRAFSRDAGVKCVSSVRATGNGQHGESV